MAILLVGEGFLLLGALIANPPKTARSMWVDARKIMFCKGPVASRLNEVGGIMIKGAARAWPRTGR
jgi:hypothetical protein